MPADALASGDMLLSRVFSARIFSTLYSASGSLAWVDVMEMESSSEEATSSKGSTIFVLNFFPLV